MKAKSIIFIFVFLISLSIIPVYNITTHGTILLTGRFKEVKESLFNIDSVMSIAGAAGNLVGISSDADKVFFGKNKWLFLGEYFNHSVSKKINGSQGYEREIKHTINVMHGWQKLSKSIGVRGFYVLIGPDKDSIYTDELPQWYVQSKSTITNELINGCDFYIKTPEILSKAKKETSDPLYFKTDTHWNELGAYSAFKGLAKKSLNYKDKLIWPRGDLEFNSYTSEAGDLSRFQRSARFLSDVNVKITSPSVSNIDISVSSYKSGSILYTGKNELIESPKEPLLVHSPSALNKVRALWLRDSFGTAMSRVMASTFYETLQVHHGRTSPEEIKKIMLDYKPDYVIVTVVERDELSKMFAFDPTTNTY